MNVFQLQLTLFRLHMCMSVFCTFFNYVQFIWSLVFAQYILFTCISLITSSQTTQCSVNVNVTFRQSYQNAVTVGTSQWVNSMLLYHTDSQRSEVSGEFWSFTYLIVSSNNNNNVSYTVHICCESKCAVKCWLKQKCFWYISEWDWQ